MKNGKSRSETYTYTNKRTKKVYTFKTKAEYNRYKINCESLDKLQSNNGTVSAGLSGNITFGLNVAFNVGLIMDSKGNIGIQATGSIGGGPPSVTIGGYFSRTNANSIYDLNGQSCEIGGSVGEGIGAGAESTYFKGAESNKDCWGYNLSADYPTIYTSRNSWSSFKY